MKYQLILGLTGLAMALNSNNRLIRIWDNLEVYDTLGNPQGSFNMTSFPYIEGVSDDCF